MTQQELPPGQEADEIEGLTMLVAENLQDGESPEKIVQQLVSNGWEEDDAIGFVDEIQYQIQPLEKSGGGGGMSWLIWIGIILLFKFLSYLFD
jgi:hypothetical protein